MLAFFQKESATGKRLTLNVGGTTFGAGIQSENKSEEERHLGVTNLSLLPDPRDVSRQLPQAPGTTTHAPITRPFSQDD